MPEFITTELKDLIAERKWSVLKDRLKDIPAPEIPELLFLAEKHDRVIMFRSLPREVSSWVFAAIEPEQQDALLHDLTDTETRNLLKEMDPDDRTALLEELAAPITRRLLGLLGSDDLMEARQLMGYPEESVGRLMTPDYVTVRPNWTAEKSISHLREVGNDSEILSMIYVTNEDGTLLDDIRLRRLIVADPKILVRDLLDSSYGSLSAFDDREKAVNMMLRYDLMALPVVDSNDELIGIVTFDDVMDVAEEEATEDIQKSASVQPLKMSYHRATALDLFSKRAGWLVALVLMNLASAAVLILFEERLAQAIVLVSFIPLLLGAGGNAGSQASTLIIRALVTNDIKIDDWLTTVGKELMVGLLLGGVLGGIGSILGYLFGGFHFDVSMVVGLSFFIIVLFANFVGMLLPFVLSKLNIDPAVASGPLITTIVDASGMLIYVLIAITILKV